MPPSNLDGARLRCHANPSSRGFAPLGSSWSDCVPRLEPSVSLGWLVPLIQKDGASPRPGRSGPCQRHLGGNLEGAFVDVFSGRLRLLIRSFLFHLLIMGV